MTTQPPQVLCLLAVGVELEALVSSLLTNTEQYALHQWLQHYWGEGCVSYHTGETYAYGKTITFCTGLHVAQVSNTLPVDFQAGFEKCYPGCNTVLQFNVGENYQV